MVVESIRRPEEPIKGIAGTVPGAYETPADGISVTDNNMESWAWTNKYMKAQRQVAQAKTLLAEPAPSLATQESVVPVAALAFAWWMIA